METIPNETNLLADDFQRPIEYATVGQRFLNHLIDLASFYILIFISSFTLALVLGTDSFLDGMESVNPILDRILSLIMYSTYIGLVEGITKGKTLGKLITKTRGVNDDGSKITFSTGFLRGLSRAVPFEAFSAFSAYPWHDQWTKTRVVKDESLN